jgi:hypothetical protein
MLAAMSGSLLFNNCSDGVIGGGENVGEKA